MKKSTNSTNVDDAAFVMSRESYEKRIQILECENARLMKCQEQIIKETNRKLELYTTENRFLQYAFEKLKKQNDELRELCYFLDDDRKDTKKVYTELMQKCDAYLSNERAIADYEENAKTAQEREKRLMEENRRLKSMCDSWTENALKSALRDCGDGSSDCESLHQPKPTNNQVCILIEEEPNESGSYTQLSLHNVTYEKLLNYIKKLEARVQQLEIERPCASDSPPGVKTQQPINDNLSCDDDSSSKVGKDDESDSDSTSPSQENANNYWLMSSTVNRQFDDDSATRFINRLRCDYYDSNTNDSNLTLSPIAEENETDISCTSSTCGSIDSLTVKNEKSFTSDDNTLDMKLISRRNIKLAQHQDSLKKAKTRHNVCNVSVGDFDFIDEDSKLKSFNDMNMFYSHELLNSNEVFDALQVNRYNTTL